MGFHCLRGWSASRLVDVDSLTAGTDVVAVGSAILQSVLPWSSRSPSDLRRKAALATKRTRTVRRSRRDPGPALSFRLAASCRRASKNSFIHFLGAGAPSQEWSGCGLFLGQAPPSPRPSRYYGLPYLRGPAQSRLLIRSCRERSCRPLGAPVGLYRPTSRWLLGTHVALHHAVRCPPPVQSTTARLCNESSIAQLLREVDRGHLDSSSTQLNSCRRIASHLISSRVGSCRLIPLPER